MNQVKKVKEVWEPLHTGAKINHRRMNPPKVVKRARLAALLLAASVGPTALASAQDRLTSAAPGQTLIVNFQQEMAQARRQQQALHAPGYFRRGSQSLIVNFQEEAAKARRGQQILEIPGYQQFRQQVQP